MSGGIKVACGKILKLEKGWFFDPYAKSIFMFVKWTLQYVCKYHLVVCSIRFQVIAVTRVNGWKLQWTPPY